MKLTEDEIVSKLIKLHNDLSYDDSYITDSSGEITIEILKDFIKDVKILENQEKAEILDIGQENSIFKVAKFCETLSEWKKENIKLKRKLEKIKEYFNKEFNERVRDELKEILEAKNE